MSIDEIFEKYPQNIFGFRLNNGVKVIDVLVNQDWVLTPNLEREYTIIEQKTVGDKIYHIVYSDNLSFYELFNCVAEMIEQNLEKARKTELFNQKMQELKKMFLEGNYDDLKKLDFKIEDAEKLD